MQKMKTNLENVSEDKHFFQQQLFKAKKVNKALIIELENNREELGIQAIEQEEKPLCITNPEPEESKLMKREDSLDEILPEPLAIKNEPEEPTKVKDYGNQDEPNTG